MLESQRNFRRVAIRAGWITATVFGLPLVFLAPFAYLSGFLLLEELIKLMTSPISNSLLALSAGTFIFLHRWNLNRAFRVMENGERNWLTAARFGRRMLMIFLAAVAVETFLGYLIVVVLLGIPFPQNFWLVPVFVLAFIAMIETPLVLTMIKSYEKLVRSFLKDEKIIFSLQFKNSFLIGVVFVGTILMLVVLNIITEISQHDLGRKLPIDENLVFLIAGIVSMGALVFLLLQQVKYIIQPMQQMVTSFEVGAGGDFRQELTLESADEVGQMGAMSNRLFASLNLGFSEIQGTVENIRKVKDGLVRIPAKFAAHS